MGIKDLKTLIKQTGTKKLLTDYRGEKIAIDVSLYMYRFAYWDQDPIVGFSRQINTLHNVQIEPVYVFDGKPPNAKAATIAERRKKTALAKTHKQNLETKINTMISKTESRTPDKQQDFDEEIMILRQQLHVVSKQIINIKPIHFESLHALLDVKHISYYDAPGEADPFIAQLCKDGFVYAVMTEDMDALTFGSQHVITGYHNNTIDIIEYALNDVIQHLNLNFEQFVDMCILCGCDYVDRLHLIGPKTALKLVTEYDNIETILTVIDPDKHRVPDRYLELITIARELFKHKININTAVN